MYAELVNAIYESITVDDIRDIQLKSMKKTMGVYKFASFGCNLNPDDVITSKKITLPEIPTPIYILRCDTSAVAGEDMVYYRNLGVIDGELSFVVIISDTMLRSRSRIKPLTTIASTVWFINSYITSLYMNVVHDTALVDIFYYAPMLCSVYLMDRVFPGVACDDIADALNALYTTPVTSKTVESTLRLLDDVGIPDLLDNSIFLGVTNEEYPDIRFADIKREENDETEETKSDEETGAIQ